uniref:Uncharacterized protein n=1 Tax=Rhizophora mucronata TaxID=61149 RepID=A0A2P2PFR9_RHIMU
MLMSPSMCIMKPSTIIF